jgi:diamine N-acetyltransferase
MTGKNISLRAPEPTDIEVLYSWENNPNTWQISNTLLPYSRFALEQYIMNASLDIYSTKQLRLMIDLLSGEQIVTIGTIDLFDFSPMHRRAGVGILIENNFRSRGYASEAMELMIEYAFNTLQLHQLYCNVSSENQASLKLFKKFGFEIVGLKKDWLSINNRWTDEYLLQLIH